jgi:starch phosphorylase
MEKWGIDMFGKLLPRHLELIYIINHVFLEQVKKKYPNNFADKVKNLSLIEESNPRQIRMANLCVVACHKIILCSELQRTILLEGIFKDFLDIRPKAFILVQNGANPRRWIYNANR